MCFRLELLFLLTRAHFGWSARENKVFRHLRKRSHSDYCTRRGLSKMNLKTLKNESQRCHGGDLNQFRIGLPLLHRCHVDEFHANTE